MRFTAVQDQLQPAKKEHVPGVRALRARQWVIHNHFPSMNPFRARSARYAGFKFGNVWYDIASTFTAQQVMPWQHDTVQL